MPFVATHLTSLSSPEIREITADDDLDAMVDLARRAFGPEAVADNPEAVARRRATIGQTIAGRRVFGAFSGGQMVASASWHDMRQWWHGRSLPMAGVAAVMVAPEFRGRGVGRTLMTEVLDAIARRGYPLSVLYPATTPIYRSLGWEMAGGEYHASLPARSLRSLLAPDISRNTAGTLADDQAGGLHAAPFRRATAGRRRRRHRGRGPRPRTGPGPRAEHAATRRPSPPGWPIRTCTPTSRRTASWPTAGGVATRSRWNGSSPPPSGPSANCGPSWPRTRPPPTPSRPGSGRTTRCSGSPGNRTPSIRYRDQWMLRLVDVQAAIAGRGFPASVQLSLPLFIQDDARDANAGLWELSVTGGRGTLVRHPEATHPLTIGARGLAALYAGTPMASLRLAGLATGGDPVADSELDGAFGGASYLLDNF